VKTAGDQPGHRLLFYSHNGVGIGHVQRQLALATAWRRRHPDEGVLVVTGSHAVGALSFPEGVDYVKLPSISMVDRYENWEPRDLALPMRKVTRMRSDLIRQTVRRFAPDVLVADFMPTGPHGELIPALEQLAAGGGRAVAGFRDIVDEPSFVRGLWSRTGVYDALRRHYAAICVYGAPEVADFERDLGVDGELASRTHYVGYLGTRARRRATLAPEGRPFVLATTGGGVDGAPLLRAFIGAARRLRPDAGGRWLIVSGPLVPEEDHTSLRAAAAGSGVEVRRSVKRLGRMIAQADVVVTMAGYNTSCELMGGTARAVVVPRDGPSQEQRMRAKQLERWSRAEVVDPLALDADGLAEAIARALAAPAPPPVPVSLRGIEAALDVFEEVAST